MRKILALPPSAKTIRLQIDTALPSMHTIHFTRSASTLYNLLHPTVSTNNYAQQLLKHQTRITHTRIMLNKQQQQLIQHYLQSNNISHYYSYGHMHVMDYNST